jgi:SAM-dependent methyltransferase
MMRAMLKALGSLPQVLSRGVHARILEETERLLRDAGPAGGVTGRRLLDVGCWDGEATLRYARAAGASALGIEIFAAPAAAARARGMEVAAIDIESTPFPWPDESIDCVVANQIFEHLKNVWLPMGEIYRVLRRGGTFIASVPNLASLHNRILLALGGQPTSNRVFGPHVRAFTSAEFERLVALESAFRIERRIGVGFYPLPASLSGPLARLWRGASHTVVLLARKAGGAAPPWRDSMAGEALSGQTFYR